MFFVNRTILSSPLLRACAEAESAQKNKTPKNKRLKNTWRVTGVFPPPSRTTDSFPVAGLVGTANLLKTMCWTSSPSSAASVGRRELSTGRPWHYNAMLKPFKLHIYYYLRTTISHRLAGWQWGSPSLHCSHVECRSILPPPSAIIQRPVPPPTFNSTDWTWRVEELSFNKLTRSLTLKHHHPRLLWSLNSEGDNINLPVSFA